MAKQKETKSKTLPAKAAKTELVSATRLLNELRGLIEQARERTAQAVNSDLVGLYRHIGRRIREDVLKEKRAGYLGNP